MTRNSRGFTIIELLVVIGIIGFLASALAVAAVGLAARSRIEKSAAIVRRLDSGCEAYHTRFQDYPSTFPKLTAADIKGGVVWPPIVSDVILYDYLAKPLTVIEGFVAGVAKKRALDPFIEVLESERSGTPSAVLSTKILDAWENPIWYELPGFTHGPTFPDRSNRFDIESWGGDRLPFISTGGSKLNPVDDVCNWSIDRK